MISSVFPDSQSGEAAPRESGMTDKTVKMGPLSDSGAVASQWRCSVDCWWLLIKSPVSLRTVTPLRSAGRVAPAAQCGHSWVGAATSALLTCTAAGRSALGATNKGVLWEQRRGLTAKSTPVMSRVTVQECGRWIKMTAECSHWATIVIVEVFGVVFLSFKDIKKK